jgi:hypothetical protein
MEKATGRAGARATDDVADGEQRAGLEDAAEDRSQAAKATKTSRGSNRNQARVACAGERKSLCSDTMLGISNLYSRGAKGHNI